MYPADLKSLTGLRIVAAGWVLVYHFRNRLGLDLEQVGMIDKGYLGVDLFFILSGFILSHVYVRAWAEGRFPYSSFLWARLARLYPVHLLTLGATIMLWGLGRWAGARFEAAAFDPAAIPQHLLLVHAWWATPTVQWNFPSWSISAEWFAYLSFPMFAYAAWRLRARPRLAVGLALALIAALYPLFQALAGFPLTEATIRWGFLRIVPCFAYGCALHALWRSGAVTGRFSGLGACLAGAAVLLAVQVQAPDPVIVMTLGGLIVALAGLAATGSRFATQASLVYLGEISYSTYMICIPWKILAINVATKLFNIGGDKLPPLVWILIVGALIPLSAISYHFIESPCREWMKSLAASRKQRRLALAGAA